ncbi:hypothetical protein AB0F72_19105 [Actinoplanes sp. NPDC023936]|uniref:hypothetical protein n=1 Tax=Actinoplanes sp. NPDC023936 TaxID=3154910 RepID=UPI0033C85131
MPDDRDQSPDLGSSTDQHVTGTPEDGTFITDEEPREPAPAHGSSNAGINATGANRAQQDADD